jgi:chromosome segregation ATPase
MKVNKLFTIDQGLIELLKQEKNASKIINQLLLDYYGEGSNKLKELEEEIIRDKEEIKRLIELVKKKEQKVLEIKERNKKVQEQLNNIPQGLLNDFRTFKGMTEDTLKERVRYYYPNLDINEALKAWELWKKS